jgi:protein-tyrosine phosphatase
VEFSFTGISHVFLGIYNPSKLGVSRSGSFALGYLIFKGNTLEESLEIARKARPQIKPLEGFIDQLRRFEMMYKV